MKCPNCGKETDEKLAYCRFCGIRLRVAGEEEGERSEGRRGRGFARVVTVIALIAMILFAVLFTASMFVNVPVGYGLILIDPLSRSVYGPVLGPTWYVKAPWVQTAQIYYTVDKIGMWGEATSSGSSKDPTADYPAVPCFSKDQLEMQIDIMVRWSFNTSNLLDLYNKYPNLGWKDTIASIVRQTIRFTTANFTAVEAVEKRTYMALTIRDEILRVLNSEPSLMKVISYFEFDLRNIGLPDTYTAAIEAKLVAEQQKLEADFTRQKIVILANASAQEAILLAQGESQAKIILANGTKQAIQMAIEAAGVTNSTRIAELYLWVEALKQIAPDVDILLISAGADGTPVIFQLPGNQTQS